MSPLQWSGDIKREEKRVEMSEARERPNGKEDYYDNRFKKEVE